ncbi:4-(cytidine 5'-diphospho)-2-C-methyl-D-erythritol kinase [Eubacteriales bacterium OttesenSCG-928-K08]|nr:4-(cytidine 5'-diphospho)-2-C-methyl-D-erythritol kinase [Eubacteriales bacterium OttesenSCG-928-K08]
MKNSTIKVSAPAKLNLVLDVVSKRPDGYHELDMLMIRISLQDTLLITPSSSPKTEYVGMSLPEGDLVLRAMEAYASHADKPFFAHVKVHKNIPSQAGLGGGSADAASTLIGLQKIYGALNTQQLKEVALSLGADVPFCLQRNPCRAKGIGELLTNLQAPEQAFCFVVCKPVHGISTAALYKSLCLPLPHSNMDAAQQAFEEGDPAKLGSLFFNAMEAPAMLMLPEIEELRAKLLRYGALGAAMTGSGSAVFGLFADEKAAKQAAKQFSDVAFCCVCHSLSETDKF